jgi:tetratricopeptide (TPR) repeat protein
LILLFVPLSIVTVVAILYRVHALAGADASLATQPLLHLLTQSIVIWRYLGLMIVPVNQAIMHATHEATSLGDPFALLAAAGLIATLAVGLWLRRFSSLYAFGIVWWFACLAPSSSLIALKELMAEHRVYVASVGLATIVAAACAHLLGRVEHGVPRIPAWFAVAFATALLALGVLTVRRNAIWDDPVRVWREGVAASPGMWEPHYALADALRESGDCVGALPEYEAALAVRPRHRELVTNYGICLGQLDRFPEAEAAFRRALAIDPSYARGYTNLAAVALLEGDAEQARDYYQRAIVVDPRNVHARLQLARIYEERLQDYPRALQMCMEARAISPSTPGAGDCISRNEQLVRGAKGGGTP